LNWGTIGGGKREWGGNGEGMGREWGGGVQFTSNLGPGWMRIAPHRKEGFQVSKRDSVTKGVIKGVGKGNWQGEFTGGCAICFVLSSWIYVSYYCVNVANKRIVFKL
jgi:hypothetical protein